MAIAWVQDKNFNENTASSSFTTAYNSNVAAGNLLTVAILPSSGATVSSVSDNLNGSWTAAASEGTSPTAYIYYFKNTASGACTLTITLSAGVNCDVIQAEWSGCDTSAPLDQNNTATSAGSTSLTGGSVTTTAANELLLSCVHCGNTATAGESGWSFQGNTTTFSATARGNLYEFNIVSSTGTYSGTGTQGASSNYGGAIATFKQASGSNAALSGTAAAKATVTGTFTDILHLSSTVAAKATVTGTFTDILHLSSTVAAKATVTGTFTDILHLTATAAAKGSLTGTFTDILHLASSVSAKATVTGTFSLKDFFNGVVSAKATVTGNLQITGVHFISPGAASKASISGILSRIIPAILGRPIVALVPGNLLSVNLPPNLVTCLVTRYPPVASLLKVAAPGVATGPKAPPVAVVIPNTPTVALIQLL